MELRALRFMTKIIRSEYVVSRPTPGCTAGTVWCAWCSHVISLEGGNELSGRAKVQVDGAQNTPQCLRRRKLGSALSGAGSRRPKLVPKVNLRILSKPTLKLALVIGRKLREKPWVWLLALTIYSR